MMTSRRAASSRTPPLARSATPVARLPSSRTRATSASCTIVRFLRCRTGSRNARAALHRWPFFCVTSCAPNPSWRAPLKSAIARILRLLRRGQERARQRREPAQPRDIELAIRPVKFVGARFAMLLAPEHRQHLVIGPAGIARRRPAVIVAPMPAHIDHAVDRARPAGEPPAMRRDRGVMEARRALVEIAPVEARVRQEQRVADRQIDLEPREAPYRTIPPRSGTRSRTDPPTAGSPARTRPSRRRRRCSRSSRWRRPLPWQALCRRLRGPRIDIVPDVERALREA